LASASLGSWAGCGLKVPLGRGWPSGLGLVGLGSRSSEMDPDLPLRSIGPSWPVGFGWAQNQPAAHLTFQRLAQDSPAHQVFDRRSGGSRGGAVRRQCPARALHAHLPGGWRAHQGSEAWSRHGVVVHRPDRCSCSRPRARRAARRPGSRDRARRCRRIAARRPALLTCKETRGTKPGSTHKCMHNDDEPGSIIAPRLQRVAAVSRGARLASGQP
jgi:hypothetical protein